VHRTSSAILLLSSLLLASLDVGAAQVLQGRPDDTLAASVSRSEPTLIRIEGHRILRMFGKDGDFEVTPDKGAGTAYIKPITGEKAFSAYATDEMGRTWKFLLSVMDGPADTIVIKGNDARNGRAAPTGRDFARNQAIKHVLVALDSEEETDMESRAANDLVPLWKEVLFVRVKVVDGLLKGEKYKLTNTSAKAMVVDERELYRRGVVAVIVADPDLKSAETTDVFVISEQQQ
jgi:conjugal transfer pilus assembly protein TraK